MPPPDADPTAPAPADLPPGRIDIHSHLIPGVDDGCRDLDESLTCVRRLIDAGYVGSICTPHIWGELFPENTIDHIRAWTTQLQRQLTEQGIDYRLWPGGEIRLFDKVVDWFKANEVPTLAGSKYVLADFWEQRWPKWVDRAFDWLIEEGYQPILAHPERLSINNADEKLGALADRGVLMQGNFRCMTGEDGFLADQLVRRYLVEQRYTFLALDMHRPDTLESRLDGLRLVEQEFSPDLATACTADAPRQHIFK